MVTINYRLEPHTSIPYHTGVAIPVFSLRSEQSVGVGDFSDLISFADFVAKSGMDLIQILPINDTTTFMDWRDSYPYRAISVFALHPIYLDMSVFREVLTDSEKADFDAQQKSLNGLETVDYEAVFTAKWHYIKIGYEKLSKNIFSSMAFLDFFAQNLNWLEPYAAFCYLRDLHHTSDYSQWGEFAKFSKDKLKKLSTSGLNLHYFVQFLLHQQLKSA
ncbi:4-alpha-glucanotransferase (amylomaltase) [Lactococcus raffinolactis 4877]|nr:4-alpha-glucanotransferase (amylomaltase) [Lactococcus raffinolactis 4877]